MERGCTGIRFRPEGQWMQGLWGVARNGTRVDSLDPRRALSDQEQLLVNPQPPSINDHVASAIPLSDTCLRRAKAGTARCVPGGGGGGGGLICAQALGRTTTAMARPTARPRDRSPWSVDQGFLQQVITYGPPGGGGMGGPFGAVASPGRPTHPPTHPPAHIRKSFRKHK